MKSSEKIIIHYIWFEDNIRYKKQGINFSTKYRFLFDPEEKKIYVHDNSTEYIDHFFGDNIDLTAIVGMNGSGKTTLLRFILSLRSGNTIHIPCVIVIEVNSEFWAGRFYFEDESKKNCLWEQLNIEGLKNYTLNQNHYNKYRFAFSENARIIYLTEMFSMSTYPDYTAGGDNLSFAAIMNSIDEDRRYTNNQVLRYVHTLFDWQIEFFTNRSDYVSEFHISYPSFIAIDFIYDEERLIDRLSELRLENITNVDSSIADRVRNEVKKLLNTFLNSITLSDPISRIKDLCAKSILMNYIFSLEFVSDRNEQVVDTIMSMIQTIVISPSDTWNNVLKLLNEYRKKEIELENNPLLMYTNNIFLGTDKYIDFMNFFSKFILNDEVHQIESRYIKISTKFIEKIKEFHDAYKQCVRILEFLSFSWGLSSGETLLLNQYGKLMSILKKNSMEQYYLPKDVNSDIPAENAIILLDEAEVAFHPEWQRVYLNAMLKFITKNMRDAGTHIQIIIATHSPIILSDIPRQNTVFIQQNKEGKTITVDSAETFAANIYSLYKSAFFLSNSMVGAFAERKLKELANDIQNTGKKGNEIIMRRILLIGDEFVRSQFLKMYHQKMDNESNIESLQRRIKELEKQVSKLRQSIQSGEEKNE